MENTNKIFLHIFEEIHKFLCTDGSNGHYKEDERRMKHETNALLEKIDYKYLFIFIFHPSRYCAQAKKWSMKKEMLIPKNLASQVIFN